MTQQTVFILGSSRSFGDTRRIIDKINVKENLKVVDLKDYNISYYDYEYKNQDDDFLPLMEELCANYEHFIFATPVYWYSMSAIMKCFFDRFTDLLKLKKDVGRSLRSKNISVISCSGGNDLDPCFVKPFKASAEYLGMNFVQHMHSWIEGDEIPEPVLKKIASFNLLCQD